MRDPLLSFLFSHEVNMHRRGKIENGAETLHWLMYPFFVHIAYYYS